MSCAEAGLKPLLILGSKVMPFTGYDQALNYVEDRLGRKRKTFCVAINPEKVYRSARDSELRRVLELSEMGICDGIGVVMAAKLLYGRKIPRCTGVDLFYQLIARSVERRWKVFLLGAGPEANAGAFQTLIRQYPTLRIVGRQDGYFQDSAVVVDAINRSDADLVFVAMGSPRQELWIAEHLSRINAGFLMGVGGTFDVVSGKVKRAPKIFRATGTEFLYRLVSNPKRWKRQLVLPLFMLSVMKEGASVRFHGTGK
jgi:N-acetylglucosaminyldiphosphoundecaprenol N-acetyl-beta-D-mannosaminyltransferase